MEQTARIPWLRWQDSARSAAENMAADDALLEFAATLGRPVLRLYGWREPAASFGYFQKLADIERTTPLRPLVRRPTGGGLVPHDADWTYSLTLPPDDPWYSLRATDSYRRLHEWVRTALAALGVTAALAPDARMELPGQCFVGHEKFDLLLDGRKIAGAAQRRTRSGQLIQGSLQPPRGLARAAFEQAFCDVAEKQWAVQWEPFIGPPAYEARLRQLADARYARHAHTARR